MTIIANGSMRFDPLFPAGSSNPLTVLSGIGESVGDASGGVNFLLFNLPADFAYIPVFLSVRTEAVDAGLVALLTIGTGEIIDGSSVSLFMEHEFDGVSPFNHGFTWDPPGMLIRAEKGRSVAMNFQIANVLNESLFGSIRAFAWDLSVLRSVPIGTIGQLIS